MSESHQDHVATELPRLTPSSVGDLECPKKFQALRMSGGKGWGSNTRDFPASVARATATHDVLRQVYRTRRGGEVNLDHVETYAKTAVWRGRFPEGVDRNQEALRVVAAACAVVGNDTESEIEGTISVERPVEFAYSHDGQPLMMVSSKIDRILVDPDSPHTLKLRDYKFTARPKISLSEAFIYLWSAKKAFVGQGFDNYVLEYEFVSPENEVTRETITGADVRGQFALVTEAAVRVIRGTEYPPVIGEACTYCPLRIACQGLLRKAATLAMRCFELAEKTSGSAFEVVNCPTDAYVAGYFDGEGCVGFHKRYDNVIPRIRISVMSANLPSLEALQARFGGTVLVAFTAMHETEKPLQLAHRLNTRLPSIHRRCGAAFYRKAGATDVGAGVAGTSACSPAALSPCGRHSATCPRNPHYHVGAEKNGFLCISIKSKR